MNSPLFSFSTLTSDASASEFLLAYSLVAGSEQKGFKRVVWICEKWRQYLGNRPISSITRIDVSRYIDFRKMHGVSNSSINREISVLSAAVGYAVKRWGWNIANPVSGLYLKMPEGRLRWLTKEESQRLQNQAKLSDAPHLFDFIRLALNTGMRRGEMLGLEWTRVDFDNARILLEGIHTKSGKRRYVPLNQGAVHALKSRLQFRNKFAPESAKVFLQKNGKPVVQINYAFRQACNKSGIVDFRIHDLRHTFASWLVGEGVPLSEVRDLLGHSSIVQTERYAHLAPGRLHQAVRILDQFDVPEVSDAS